MTQNMVAGVRGEGGAIGAALTEVAWGKGSTAAARKSKAGSTRGRRAAPGG